MELILQSVPMEYQLPLIVIVALGFPIIAMAFTNRLFAQYRVANIAKRMGLTIAEGNPKLNMVNAIPLHNLKMGAGVGGSWLSRAINTTKETKVRLVGAPHGRPRPSSSTFAATKSRKACWWSPPTPGSNAGSACK